MPALRRLLLAATMLVAALTGAGRPLPAQSTTPVQEVVRSLLVTAGERVIQSVREVAPGVMQRIDSIIDARRGAHLDEPAGRRTGRALLQVLGVSIVGLVLALAVLVTVLGPLEGIIRTIEADVGGAFWRGLIAQVITLPVLSLLVLALALTVIGLLLVPIVLMGASLAVAGIGTLAMVAVAAVIGRARAADDVGRSRAGLLRALLTGYGIVWAPWFAAAAFVAVPGVGLLSRLVALASSWGIITVGIGATIRSRGGRLVPDLVAPALASGKPAPAPDWSTPTPVTGVVAAQRPTQP